jgi:hypothetical protein
MILSTEEVYLAKLGKKLEAVQSYKNRTHCSLGEAVTMVSMVMRQLGQWDVSTKPVPKPPEPKKKIIPKCSICKSVKAWAVVQYEGRIKNRRGFFEIKQRPDLYVCVACLRKLESSSEIKKGIKDIFVLE